MVNLLPQPLETTFMTFFFVLVRVFGTIFTMPVYGATSVPRPVRVGIAFWIAVVLCGPTFGLNDTRIAFHIPLSTRIFNGVVGFILAGGCEFIIGLALGFIAHIMIMTIGLAGEMMGKEAGFSAASVFDPITGQDNFLLAQVKIWFGTILFLVIGGPELVLQALADSFRVIYPGEGMTIASLGSAGFYTLLYDQGRQYALMTLFFSIGIQIALPMIGAMLLVSLSEAFIARTAPQLNIMSVGFAIRISISLFILGNLMSFIIFQFKPFLLLYHKYAAAFLSRLAPN